MMKARLIKHRMAALEEEQKQQPAEVPIINTIQSWVREFQSTKADRVRSDFERVRNSRRG